MLTSQVYFGVVEDRNDPLKLGRCRVRIAKCHTHDLSLLPTQDLPWATVVQPIEGGMGKAVLAPVEGTLVQVQFFDYPDNQMPIVTGIIPTIPQPQTVFVDQFEEGAILKDELTPQGRQIPTNDLDATGGVASVALNPSIDTPTLNNIQQQGLYTQSNNPNALLDSMVSVTAVQIGSVGNLAQTETSVGQAVKSKKDDFETEVLSLGKSDAIQSFAGKIAQSLGSSLPTELLNGTTSIQSVLSKLNEYFSSNGLTNLSKETTARLGVLNISNPSDYVMNLSTGLGTLKDSIRSSFANTLSIDSLSNARESVSSAINSFDLGNLTSLLSSGSTAISSAQAIASSIGNGYTSMVASAKNLGNISAVEEKGIDKISSEAFANVGEGLTPPTQGAFGGANYGGAEPIQEKPSQQDTTKYPNGATRELDFTSIGIETDKLTSLLSACKTHGLLTLEAKASFFAILYIKNGIARKSEESSFEVKDLIRRFPLSFVGKEELAKQYSLGKKTESEFFNFVYDSSNDGRTYGNIYPSDGYTYHGYGYLPIVGRNAYTKYSKVLNNENLLGGFEYLVENETICADIAVLEFLSRTNGVSPTAHPQFFYVACKVFGMDVATVEPIYCKLYGAYTQNQFGIGEYVAGNTPEPSSFYPNKDTQNETGYIDPNHRYPRDRTTSQASTNKLAKGVIQDTIVTKKEQMRRIGVPLAMNRGTWDQPHVAYGAKYPFNNVTETESGHVVEYDDTPQHERIHLYHRKGTFEEIDQNGTKVTRIVGDNYTIVDRNGFVSIDGEANVTVSGTANIYVRNDANIQVEGSTELKVGGSLNVGVAKDFNLATQGNINMFANGTFRLQSKKDGHILTGEDLYVASTGVSHYKSDSSMFITSQQNQDVLVKGNRKETIGQNDDCFVKGNKKTTIEQNDDHLVKGNHSTEVKGNANTLIEGSENHQVNGSVNNLTKGSVKVQANGSMDIKADSSLKLKGSSVHIKGDSNVNLGSTTLNLKSSAVMNLQSGASMNLNSGGVLGLQGKPVNLNSGGVGTAQDADSASGANGSTNAEVASEATEAVKALVYGMIPPALGTPTNINLPPLVTERPIGEDEFIIETVEDAKSPIASVSLNSMIAEEGISNTDEGQTIKPNSSVSETEESPYRDEILNMTEFRADTKLSEHFTLGMFFDGGFNNKHKLINQAGLTKQQIILNLSRLANNVLEKFLEKLPNGINGYNKLWRITSGYRMTASPNAKSDHCKGCAVDIQLCSRNKMETWKLVQELEKLINYHQILLEYRGARSVWIHTAYRGEENKKQAMTFVNDKKYRDGFTLLA